MGLIARWAEILGERVSEPFRESPFPFAREYAKAWCRVVQKYPRLTGNTGYGRAFISGACPALGFPDPDLPPPPPFEEAPCPDKQYDVVLTITRQFNNNPPQTYNSPILRVYGPIQEIGLRQSPTTQTSFIEGFVRGFDADGAEYITVTSVGGVGFQATLDDYSITRTDGSLDNTDCFDPFGDLPPDPPIDEEDFNPVVPIPRYDDENNPLPPLEVPIIININPDVDLNVDIEIGGDKYDIDFEGLKKRDPVPKVDVRRFPKPTDDDVNVKPVVDTEEEGEVEEEVTEDEELLWVLVDVISAPRKGKSIVYKNADDITYFAGYFHWLVDGQASYRMPEIPIRKQRNAFQAPQGVKGYRILAVNGATLSARAYTQVLSADS